MSGIFGLFFTDPIEIPAGVARTAAQILSPSGQERTTLWETRSCLLGVCHPRKDNLHTSSSLSTNESGRIHAVHEGNILNETDIHHRLERERHIFTEGGETGVLAHLSEGRRLDWELGLRGSFSLAVWDGYERSLRLAVDRSGAGCLYWTGDKSWTAFASTLPALRGMLLELGKQESAHTVPHSLRRWIDASGWRMDLQVVRGYFTSGCIASPYSICHSVYSLPPAGRLNWKAGNEPFVEVWWTPRSHPRRTLSLRNAIPEFTQVFHETLPFYVGHANQNALCLSADPASYFLCKEVSSRTGGEGGVHALHGEESTVQERETTHEWAAALPGEYQEHLIPSPTGDEVLLAIRAMSEPCGHPSAWNAFAALRAISGTPGIWLDGTGSDEVWSVPPPGGSWWRRNPTPLAREMGRYHLDPEGCFGEGLLAPETETEPLPFSSLKRVGGTDLDRIDALRMSFSLPYLQLRPLHTMAAARALDIRFPWLDPILMEWMSRLPRGLKTNGGITHWLLRKVLQAGSASIPQTVLTQRDRPTTPPSNRWLSRDLAQLFGDTALSTGAATGPLFRASRLRQAFEANRAGVVDLGQPLWSMLILELWLRENRLAV